MSLLVVAICRWLVSKGFVILIAGALLVGGFAFYTFVKEGMETENRRNLLLAELQVKSDLLGSEIVKYEKRLVEIGDELKAAQKSLTRARRGIEYLSGALAKIEYVFMSSEERAQYEQRLEREKKREAYQETLIQSLNLESLNIARLKEVALNSSTDFQRRIVDIEATQPSLATYALESWRTVKRYFYSALIVILFGPLAYKLFAYFVAGPFLAWAKPIQFSNEDIELPLMGASGVSASVELIPGNVAWIKESYLQASDEDFIKKTCFVLDWRIPFTCMAAGLVELIEFRLPEKVESASMTVSTQDRSDVELVDVTLGDESSLIIRPSHIAGIVSRKGDRTRIKRHWRLFNIQSWVTLQFRYFEISGPCVVFISGVRGVRAERIRASSVKGRRTNQSATIGFVPSLRYSAIRAETFWSYLRGFNPLFDDVFKGEGMFLCQEISSSLDGAPVRKFWSQIWSSMLKILGI